MLNRWVLSRGVLNIAVKQIVLDEKPH